MYTAIGHHYDKQQTVSGLLNERT